MEPINRVLVCGFLVVVVGTTARTTSGGSSQSQTDATLERAASYLDNSSVRLDGLVSAIQKGTEPEIDEALIQYMREFSQFHVTIGQLRIGKKDSDFANHTVTELKSQMSRLEAIRNDLPPSAALAFSEALGHLRSALEMVNQKLDSKSHHVLTMGADGPVLPGAASK
jgi:hypothetical protein